LGEIRKNFEVKLTKSARRVEIHQPEPGETAPHLGYIRERGNFTDFYEHISPIVCEADERVKAFRTHLVRATVQTMSNVLCVLGFVPLEEILFSWVTPQILLSTA
jgi:hypothetical protein